MSNTLHVATSPVFTYLVKVPVVDEQALSVGDRHDTGAGGDDLRSIVVDRLANCERQLSTIGSVNTSARELSDGTYPGLYAP